MSRITDPAITRQAVSALYSDADVDEAASRTTAAARVAAPKDSDSISIRSRHTLRAFSSADEDEDPWSAIPRRPANPSHPAPEDVVTMPRAQRNQLLLRALLQLLALFVVCLIGLAGTLWLALPVISPEDKAHLKIPRNFEDLQQLNTILQHYKSAHFFRVLLCWVVVYMFLQAFSIPGSMYMSILAGALFGVPVALPLVCVSVATGASICYLISKFLGVVLIALPTWQRRVDEWKAKLAEHDDNLLSYLVVIRMMPLPPHNVVNILSPHLGINLGIFWLSTAGGIFAVSVIHTTIGEKLDQMTSADDFGLLSWRNAVLLGGVCVAVLIPVAVKRWGKGKGLEGDDERGQVYLEEGEGEEDAQRLPDSFRRNLVAFNDSDDDDELPPHRSLDTTHITTSPPTLGTAGLGGGEIEDASESFPNWSARGEDLEEDGEDDDGRNSSDYGRGGIFSDRHTSARQSAIGAGSAGNAGKLKQWIAGSTGIRL
ncbi:hypothetical protein EX895_002823 [Sporisorium graminicola]|uniref:VTT domain-containing protein n=1 Tax=Sporisorium graminicola TaxID=280036 RepID=A0A4U7KUC3_9BASI|nr:hypothetical protein EX895_002823 [Sporisorium graminicola]TKY88113.1 hypothetical protein EX895_002823 [Sporisorium graminicola]